MKGVRPFLPHGSYPRKVKSKYSRRVPQILETLVLRLEFLELTETNQNLSKLGPTLVPSNVCAKSLSHV